MNRRLRPSPEDSKKAAEAQLSNFGIKPTDDWYEFYRDRLAEVYDETNEVNRTFLEIGTELRQISENTMLPLEATARLRELADKLLSHANRKINYGTLGAFIAAAIEGEKRQISLRNLRPQKDCVSDEQILEATRRHKTRQQQADYLGLSIRQVQRRISKIKT